MKKIIIIVIFAVTLNPKKIVNLTPEALAATVIFGVKLGVISSIVPNG